MANIVLSCDTKADHYDLSIYDDSFNGLFFGEANSDITITIDQGTYYLFWRLFGDEDTPYTVKLEGVESPTKPFKRKIWSGQAAAADQCKFTVS